MAVLQLAVAELAEDYRKYPITDHGKVRFQFFTLPAVAVAGDINTTIDLCDLPPGRVRILPNASRISTSAWGASRTLSIGHLLYDSRDAGQNSPEAANPTALVNAMDVSSAVNAAAFSTTLKYDIYSKAGVRIQGKVAGGTIPVGATLSGYIAYLYE